MVKKVTRLDAVEMKRLRIVLDEGSRGAEVSEGLK